MFCFLKIIVIFILLHSLSLPPCLAQEVISIQKISISELPDEVQLSPLHLTQMTDCMRNIPKSELHLHLGGSWPLDYLKEVATRQEFDDLCLMIDQIHERELDYHSAFQVFNLISKIMHSDTRIENGVKALSKALIKDNVVYAELRTGLKDLGSGLEGYLKALLRGIKSGADESLLKVGLILSLRRDTSLSMAEETIDLALKYRHEGIIGIDVSGDSTLGDGKHIFPALLRAKNNQLPITLHIGESKNETAQQQMLELMTIQPERIGHGVHLCEDGKKWIKEKMTLVELCLTSALKTGMINDAKEHPALKLLMEGHPVAICTDDPLIFKTTLSEEYAQVALVTRLNPEELQELQKQTQAYHFCSY